MLVLCEMDLMKRTTSAGIVLPKICSLTLSARQSKTNNEPSHQDLRIYTICHSGFDCRRKPLFASVDKSKFNNWRVHLRNSWMNGLKSPHYNDRNLVINKRLSSTMLILDAGNLVSQKMYWCERKTQKSNRSVC